MSWDFSSHHSVFLSSFLACLLSLFLSLFLFLACMWCTCEFSLFFPAELLIPCGYIRDEVQLAWHRTFLLVFFAIIFLSQVTIHCGRDWEHSKAAVFQLWQCEEQVASIFFVYGVRVLSLKGDLNVEVWDTHCRLSSPSYCREMTFWREYLIALSWEFTFTHCRLTELKVTVDTSMWEN